MTSARELTIAEVAEISRRLRGDLDRIREKQELAIMFIDLAGSTQYKHEHPHEEEWLARLAAFLSAATSIVQERGIVVKYIGDELMATFGGPSAILDAEHVAERLLAFTDEASDLQVQIRAAMDYGSASLLKFGTSPADPQGTVVDRAARIASKALAGTVLCSETVYAASRAQNRWRQCGSFAAKGIPGKTKVYQLVWKGAPEVKLTPSTRTLDQCERELREKDEVIRALKALRR